MTACRTYVQMIGSGGFFAVCRVHGSDPFPDRKRLAVAEEDAQAHAPLVHSYARETLTKHEAKFSRKPL